MKELIKHIITASKVLGAIGTIALGALWFDAKFDKQTEDLEDIKITVDYINTEQSFLAEDIQGIHDTLENFEVEHKKRGEQIESLGWAIRNINNFTPEQLEEVLNREFERDRVYNRTSELEFIPIE